jgi:hypothetical protein
MNIKALHTKKVKAYSSINHCDLMHSIIIERISDQHALKALESYQSLCEEGPKSSFLNNWAFEYLNLAQWRELRRVLSRRVYSKSNQVKKIDIKPHTFDRLLRIKDLYQADSYDEVIEIIIDSFLEDNQI